MVIPIAIIGSLIVCTLIAFFLFLKNHKAVHKNILEIVNTENCDGFLTNISRDGSITFKIFDRSGKPYYIDQVTVPQKEVSIETIALTKAQMQKQYKEWTDHQLKLASSFDELKLDKLKLVDQIAAEQREADREIDRLKNRIEDAKREAEKTIENIKIETKNKETDIKNTLVVLNTQKNQKEAELAIAEKQLSTIQNKVKEAKDRSNELETKIKELENIFNKNDKGSVRRKRWLIVSESADIDKDEFRKRYPTLRINPVISGAWVVDTKEDEPDNLLKDFNGETFSKELLFNKRMCVFEFEQLKTISHGGWADKNNWPAVKVWSQPY